MLYVVVGVVDFIKKQQALIPLGWAKSQMQALAAGPFGVIGGGLWRASPIMTLPRGQPTGGGDEKGVVSGDLSLLPSWRLRDLGRAKSQMQALAAG